jgi:NAD(P)H-hydrate epimerase
LNLVAKGLNKRLTKQLEDLSVPFTEDFSKELEQTDYVVDAIFGTTIQFIFPKKNPLGSALLSKRNADLTPT